MMSLSHKLRSLLSALFVAHLAFALPAQAEVAGDTLKPLTPMVDKGVANQPASSIAPSSQPKLLKIQVGVSQEYVLGPGDVMSVTDMSDDKPAVSMSPILPDGTAVTSYTGVIQAAGLSLRQINELVNQKAEKWYVNPHIIVNLAKQRPTQIYLLGEVVHPGYYTTGGGGAGMQSSGGSGESDGAASSGDSSGGGAGGGGDGASTITLSAVLQEAGGLKETADVRRLRVTRLAPKQTFEVDLWKLMLDGDVSEDIVLQPGDVVYVPKGGADFNAADFGRLVNNSPKVRVFGDVNQPGLLAMSPDDDLLSVIAKAGGFRPDAVTKYVVLARTNRDGTVSSQKVNMSKAIKDGHSVARDKICPGDLVIVKRSPTKVVAIQVGRTASYLPTFALSLAASRFVSK